MLSIIGFGQLIIILEAPESIDSLAHRILIPLWTRSRSITIISIQPRQMSQVRTPSIRILMWTLQHMEPHQIIVMKLRKVLSIKSEDEISRDREIGTQSDLELAQSNLMMELMITTTLLQCKTMLIQ